MTRTVEGTVLAGPELEPIEGRVIIQDGEIAAVEETDTDATDIVLPAFVNAHAHIGDSIAKEVGTGLDMDELVAPPAGLKHRLLRQASQEEIVAAMTRTIDYMAATGTAAFLEFREGGVEGVRAVQRAVAAADSPVRPVVLGRETVAAMEAGDGFGASGARDGDFIAERRATGEAGKLFGIHAGERDPADVNGALDLEPDFLVHMVHLRKVHLERLENRETPVVVCPRSNLVTGVGLPPFEELIERTTVALGTDNAFLNAPSMFREMEFAAKLSSLSARQVLRMATVNAARVARLDCGVLEAGRPATLLVLDGDSDNLAGARHPVRAVVRRAGASDVRELMFGRTRG